MNDLKPKRTAISVLGLATVLVILAMAGCASTGGMKHGMVETTARKSTDKGWWYASFHINWPQDEDPAFYTDLLIAHRIISPVLDEYRKDILLWRFHRRAARDESGHRFSFIFYSTAANARKIYWAIDSSVLLAQLQAQGVILRVHMDDTNTIGRPGLDATSDPHWSAVLQKAWPYFIMGVSQTWLDLISRYAGDERGKSLSTSDMLAFYREVDQKVETTWQKEGGHAFLHHLNAIFGYGPVNLRDKTQMQF